MKTTRLYIDYVRYEWRCYECGLPNFFSLQPQGLFTLNGQFIQNVTPEDREKGLIVKCARTKWLPGKEHVKCCKGKRRVFLENAMLVYPTKKLCLKLNQKHTDLLNRELAEMNAECKKLEQKSNKKRKKK